MASSTVVRPVVASAISDSVHWLAGIPTILLFLTLALIGLVIAAGLSWLSGRVIEDDVRTRTSTSVTTVVGVVAALYAVLVAFVIVNEWQTFNDAQAHVSDESAALTSAFVNSSVLPEPAHSQIQKQILDYDRSVICDEFPYLTNHAGPALATRRALEKLYGTVADVSPEVQASPFYSAVVGDLNDITKARRARINSATSPLPDLLLIVVLTTSLALVAVASVLDTQHRRWHLILTVALTLLVSLNLALIVTFNRPYDGAAKVSDVPLREGVPSALLVCEK